MGTPSKPWSERAQTRATSAVLLFTRTSAVVLAIAFVSTIGLGTATAFPTSIPPRSGPNQATTTAAQTPSQQTRVEQLPANVDANRDTDSVPIPTNYRYDGPGTKDARHDYCSYSPDQYPAPGRNANFSGACARHDMCYDAADAANQGYAGCNNALWVDMTTVCSHQYKIYDLRRQGCLRAADVYWIAVTGSHVGHL
ncbi:hypothetical protein GOEFS_036_00810 [Gordonia effusa NBRC 100432]|uniref:Phospholipase A2 domain-containing protein n=1 Tax=Gordonia effusa NBRC 100432 TaxID=1077974 RepID=H0QXU1_9ACTN|nr:hypothetical protein GOEFS_036_00810 [Gordonia effusa NBRC 100432]